MILHGVLATFENLFYRFPTTNELSKSSIMVDGQPSILFFKNGSTKLDFSYIVTECNEFYQGMIIDMYRTFLLRDPINEEIDALISDFISDKDLKQVQKSILITEEYAGF